MKNKAVIELVIAALNGIDVDGETMQYIIEKTNMTEQMKSQLGIESGTKLLPQEVIDQITNDIAVDINNVGLDLIEDQDFGINSNEIYLESIDLSIDCIEDVVRNVLNSHFTPME